MQKDHLMELGFTEEQAQTIYDIILEVDVYEQ